MNRKKQDAPAAETAEAPESAQTPAQTPQPPQNPALQVLAELMAQQLPPMEYLRAMIAGRPSTGKTHLILSMPRPLVVLYCDRASGDRDLREKDGIFRYYIRRDRGVVRNTLAFLDRISCGDLSGAGIQSVSLDSLRYLQNLVEAEQVPADREASLRNNKTTVHGTAQILNSLLSMDQHVLITSHLRSQKSMGRDKEGREIQVETWEPDAMPAVREIVMREAALMGYTWRKAAEKEGDPDVFGVNFTERMHGRGKEWRFADAKAPPSWGATEPADVSEWISRLYGAAA